MKITCKIEHFLRAVPLALRYLKRTPVTSEWKHECPAGKASHSRNKKIRVLTKIKREHFSKTYTIIVLFVTKSVC